ncbi:Heparinase II/III-like protein [Planctomycetes bacterium CA13]|uniref:Heparinase II/III-like protein n=1 Tax=Novipirellula herctigrandis TaxID=2527986 RepID=A0A5C5YW01_9BACT|nr:Heparinase II/III-like protein [Planctomycetes bacterium CA13]
MNVRWFFVSLFLVGLNLIQSELTADSTRYAYPPKVSIEEVAEKITSASKDHPRLFADGETLHQLRESVKQSALKKRIADGVIKNAEALQDIPPVERKLEGRRLLSQSRRCLERVLTLSTAFYLTDDERFVRRCEREMLAAAAFEDWNPSHFLDVGEMTLALAIGYDWLYHQLAPESRETIAEAIVKKGVSLPWETRHKGWVRAENNWGQVCHAGLTAGAIAVMDFEPELAAKTIHNAITNVPRSMKAFAPQGSYPEGPGYWSYGTGFNVVLVDAIETTLGTDFGLSAAPGFSQTGGYLAMVTGPSGLTFNYADGGSGRSPQSSLFWFANRYNMPGWLRGETARFEKFRSDAGPKTAGRGGNRLLPLALLWMGNSASDESANVAQNKMPLHFSSGGTVPITIHRSDWDQAPATFLGTKAGSPSANHGNMDAGSFVLDADGVRWASDLGAEGYHGIESRGMDLWNRRQDSDRWKIFRQSNESHNTLVINGKLQRASGYAKVVDFSDDLNDPYTVIDLTDVYKDQVKSAVRTFRMLPSGEVTIQDEIQGLNPGATVRWGMITTGTPAPKSPSQSMVLLQNDKQFRLKLESPSSVEWQVIDTEKPRNEWDSANRGTRMIAAEAIAPTSGKLNILVRLSPGSTID